MPTKSNSTSLPLALRLTALTNRIMPPKLRRMFGRLPLVADATKGLLDRSAPPGLVEVRVASGALRGRRLKVDLRSEREYWLGTYEKQFIPTISAFCKPGMTVYDLGANIGYTALAFAHVVGRGGRVFAFEPFPANIRRVRDHIELNDLENVVTLVPRAVSDHSGTETFLVHASHEMGKIAGSAERETTYVDRIEVRGVSLDEFVYDEGNPPPDAIKLDIEGGGVRAIPGMRRVLAAARPILFAELHGEEEQQAAWDALRAVGYQLLRMQEGFPPIAARDELRSKYRQHIIGLPPGFER